MVVWAILLLCTICFCGCSSEGDEQAVIGKTFVYEEQGFGGNFAITINEDGTFQYYEGMLSSYIGIGSWEVEDGKITITDDPNLCGNERKNTFEIKKDSLIWIEQGSDNFIYIKLEDGASFSCSDKNG